jgi:hypothetical protein
MQQSKLAARKLTASTKSTPRELRPIPYDLIGPTALRFIPPKIVDSCAVSVYLLERAGRDTGSMLSLTRLALSWALCTL